jgi:hypothetical protein
MGCEVAGHNYRFRLAGPPESGPSDEGKIADLTTLADA